METLDNIPVLQFESAKEWEYWLEHNQDQPSGVWLKIAKKDSGIPSVTHSEALDIALCFGWIDAIRKSHNEAFFLQKFTPRRPRSLWSKVNVEKVTKLMAEGKMRPAGLAAINAAKSDGRWDRAYDSPKNSTISPDFQAALDKNPRAKAFYETLNKTNRFAFTWRIQTAKKPETRRARIEKFIALLNDHQTLH